MQIRPIVGMTCTFVLGIAIGIWLQTPAWIWIAVGVAVLAIAWWIRSRSDVAALGCVFACAAAFGIGRTQMIARAGPDDVLHHAWQEVTLHGIVADQPDVREKSTLFALDVDAVRSGKKIESATGRVQIILFGGEEGLVSYGNLVEVHGYLREPDTASNPGGFSYRSYLAARGIRCTLSSPTVTVVERRGGNPIRRLAFAARRHIERGVRLRVDPDRAAVLVGVMFGTSAGIDPQVQRDFQTTGTVHILSASGLHVAVIAMSVMWLLGRLWIPRRVSAIITILFVIVYAMMAGLSPPILRAAVMYGMYAGALVLGRMPDGKASLAGSALILLVANPLRLLDIGFQLSFVCVIGILYIWPVFGGAQAWMTAQARDAGAIRDGGRRAGLLRGFLGLVLMSVAIQISIAPLTAHYFGRVQWLSAFANLVMSPASCPMLALGALVGVTGWRWVGWAADRTVALVLTSTHWMAQIPGSNAAVKPFGTWNTILYYAAIAALVFWHGQRVQDQNRTSGDTSPHPG